MAAAAAADPPASAQELFSTSSAARDAEEEIEILREWPLDKLKAAMANGELLLPSLQTCFSALRWLEANGRLGVAPVS